MIEEEMRTQSSHPFSEHLFIRSQGIYLAAHGAFIHPLAEHSLIHSRSIQSSLSTITFLRKFIHSEH